MALPPLLRRLLPEALDHDTFTITGQRPDAAVLRKSIMVVQNGSADTTNGLISPAGARTVAVVDRTGNLSESAEALVAARFALGGRSPYSPDVVLVHEFAMKPFVETVIQHASKYLAGENGDARQNSSPRRSTSSSLLNSIHKDRGSRVLVSGDNWGVVEVQDR